MGAHPQYTGHLGEQSPRDAPTAKRVTMMSMVMMVTMMSMVMMVTMGMTMSSPRCSAAGSGSVLAPS